MTIIQTPSAWRRLSPVRKQGQSPLSPSFAICGKISTASLFFFSCWHLQLKKTTIMCLIHMKRHLEIWNTSRFSISPQGSNRSWTRALEDLAALYSSGACREEHLRMGDEVLPVLQKQQQSPRERHSLRKLQPWILGGFSSQEFNGMADWPVVGGM